MTANTSDQSVRIRFYASLEAGLVAWAVMMLAVGGAFGIDRLPLYVLIMTGMLAILGAAMKHPAYRRLKGDA